MDAADDEWGLAREIRTDPVESPAESHLEGFRFIDRRFSGNGPSVLLVGFRQRVSPKTGKVTPPASYAYESMDHTGLRATYAAMEVASSPGTVLHADLISKGNRGKPIADWRTYAG